MTYLMRRQLRWLRMTPEPGRREGPAPRAVLEGALEAEMAEQPGCERGDKAGAGAGNPHNDTSRKRISADVTSWNSCCGWFDGPGPAGRGCGGNVTCWCETAHATLELMLSGRRSFARRTRRPPMPGPAGPDRGGDEARHRTIGRVPDPCPSTRTSAALPFRHTARLSGSAGAACQPCRRRLWKARTALRAGSALKRETPAGCRWNLPPRAEGKPGEGYLPVPLR